MRDSLASIDFDFIDYYKNKLVEAGARTTFKYLVCNKLGVKRRRFEQWVQREDNPSGDIQIRMIAIILDLNNKLPNYK